jgi:hypothetical protein
MSAQKGLTRDQEQFHEEITRWSQEKTEPPVVGLFQKVDAVVDSHFDLGAFVRHMWYLRDSRGTDGGKLPHLRDLQATVQSKYKSLGIEEECELEEEERRWCVVS